MAIPPEFANRSLYHFTHVLNLPNILKYGLLSTNEGQNLGVKYMDIANRDIQYRRSLMEVTCGHCGVVHDYVPLYFCKRSPMLYSIVKNTVAQNLIIYLEFPIQILEFYSSVFTDASANTSVPPTFYNDTSQLVNLDWNSIETSDWGQQYDTGPIPIRQKKQAEALIYKVLPLDTLRKIVVKDNQIKLIVEKTFELKRKVAPSIVIKGSDYYFSI